MMEGGLGWIGWTLLGIVPPLIFLLYFLKLRRAPIQVPSTYLWSRTIEDLQVNSLWQKLRNSLLLWLQILIALLILLACLRPGCDSTDYTAGRHIFLLDTSASMKATDLDSSRFESSKESIRDVVQHLPPKSMMMLMTTNDSAQIRQSYTTDRNLLLRKLDEVEVTSHLTDLSEAMTAATGLSNPSEIRDVDNTMTPEEIANEAAKNQAMLHLYSDGCFPEIEDVNLGQLLVDYSPMGKTAVDNLGIIAFNGEFSSADKTEISLFGRIENFGSSPRDVELQLYRNGNLVDALQRTEIPAGEIVSLDFVDQVPTADREVVEYRLQIVGGDDFTEDDTSYCVMNPGRKSQVLLISSMNPNLATVLSTTLIAKGLELQIENPEFLQSDAYKDATLSNVYELVIFDRVAPEKMPLANTMFWDATPPEAWELEAMEQPIFVVLTHPTHPLTAGLQLDSLAFSQASSVTGPQSSLQLISGNDGSLATIAPREGFQDLVLGFALVQDTEGSVVPVTDWPGRVSFPIFIHNTLEFLANLGRKEVQSSIRPGQILSFRMEDVGPKVEVTDPTGVVFELRQQTTGGFSFSGTDQLGVYRVRDDEGIHKLSFAVSLSDRRESDIRVREEAIVGGSEVSADNRQQVPRASQWWRYLLIAALGVIVFEWYVYNRRILL